MGLGLGLAHPASDTRGRRDETARLSRVQRTRIQRVAEGRSVRCECTCTCRPLTGHRFKYVRPGRAAGANVSCTWARTLAWTLLRFLSSPCSPVALCQRQPAPQHRHQPQRSDYVSLALFRSGPGPAAAWGALWSPPAAPSLTPPRRVPFSPAPVPPLLTPSSPTAPPQLPHQRQRSAAQPHATASHSPRSASAVLCTLCFPVALSGSRSAAALGPLPPNRLLRHPAQVGEDAGLDLTAQL